ncbi:hypothetical protein PM082_016830 [Marasmius tenuissimus]|nr:hypothetical protein PM082_016830 [Marasmius tenuissimus]
MFNYSRSPTILGGTFSVVHGNQLNYYRQSLRSRRGFISGEEWKEDIYREYERTSRGNLKIVRTISETQVDQTSLMHGSNSTVRARHVIQLACIINGMQESQLLLSIKYTGRDAKKHLTAD